MKRAEKTSGSRGDDARPALAWMQGAHAEDEVLREVERVLRRQRQRRIIVGGTVLAAAAVVALMMQLGPRSMTPQASVAAPVVASAGSSAPALVRPAEQALADGSTVELKEDAEIRVEFGPEFRRVTLVRGEAHFTVAKDAARPFVVRAGQVDVCAVGTAFAVQLATSKVDVLVTEGTVRVGRDAGTAVRTRAGATRAGDEANEAFGAEAAEGNARVAQVTAGMRCVVESDFVPRVQGVSRADADERLAWRIPQLEFSNTPLVDIVTALNAYAAGASHPKLEIATPALREIKLTGFLRADNVEGLVKLLETNFGVVAEREGELVRLRKW